MAAATSVTSNGPVCAICLDEVSPNDNIFKLNCNHQYHRNCIQPWLAIHDICPLDRLTVTSINGIARVRLAARENRGFHVIEMGSPLIVARFLHRHNARADDRPDLTQEEIKKMLDAFFIAIKQEAYR